VFLHPVHRHRFETKKGRECPCQTSGMYRECPSRQRALQPASSRRRIRRGSFTF
jgi:hypothetical protein